MAFDSYIIFLNKSFIYYINFKNLVNISGITNCIKDKILKVSHQQANVPHCTIQQSCCYSAYSCLQSQRRGTWNGWWSSPDCQTPCVKCSSRTSYFIIWNPSNMKIELLTNDISVRLVWLIEMNRNMCRKNKLKNYFFDIEWIQ